MPIHKPFNEMERAIFDVLSDSIFLETILTTDTLDELTIKISEAIQNHKPKFKHYLKGKRTKRVPSRTRIHNAA